MTSTAERRREERQRHYARHREEVKAKARAYYHANRERVHLAEVERKYGFDRVAYLAMLVKQGERCRICRRDETFTRGGRLTRLSVDHDHATGTVRGLLCMDCNRAIGLFGDDPDRLESAAAYLRGHPR